MHSKCLTTSLGDYEYITDQKSVSLILIDAKKERYLSIDTENSGGLSIFSPNVKLLMFQIEVGGKAYVIDARKVDISPFKEILEDSKYIKVLQYCIYDYKILRVLRQLYLNGIYDTKIAECLLDAGISKDGHSLDALSLRYLGIHMDKDVAKEFNDFPYDGEFTDRQIVYAANDVLVLPEIRKRQQIYLNQLHLNPIAQLEFSLAVPVAKMELAGIKIDADRWRESLNGVKKRLFKISNDIRQVLPNPPASPPKPIRLKKDGTPYANTAKIKPLPVLNLNSPQQLAEACGKIGIDFGKANKVTRAGLTNNTTLRFASKMYQDEPTKHDLIESVIGYRGLKQIEKTFGENLLEHVHDDGRIHASFNQNGTNSGRFSSSKPNLQNIQKKGEEGKILRSCFIPEVGNKFVIADYCVVPDTKVLTADLVWRRVADLEFGVELIGFTEEPTNSKFQPAKVLDIKKIIRPCFRIKTNKGEVTSSGEHRWLYCGNVNQKGNHKREWKQTSELRVGDKLPFYVKPWSIDVTFDGGYLAGFVDGEGYISENKKSGKASSIRFGQKLGTVFTDVLQKLNQKGFDVGYNISKDGVAKAYLRGSGSAIRFLGIIRPTRFIKSSRKFWDGHRTWSKNSQPAIVEKIEYVGEQEVCALSTTTKTFIAEGFMSHNSQIELRIAAEMSGDEKMIETLNDPRGDIHRGTAAEMYKVPYEQVTSALRRAAKTINFGIIYGMSSKTLADRLACGIAEAVQHMITYTATYPTLMAWMEKIGKESFECGHSKTIGGRIRWFPSLNPKDADYKKRKEFYERVSRNHPVQGTSADMTKTSMVYLDKVLYKYEAQMVNTIHDELCIEVPDRYAVDVARLTKRKMIFAGKRFLSKVPVLVDVKIRDCWYKDNGVEDDENHQQFLLL